MLSLNNIFPHTRVAKGLLQIAILEKIRRFLVFLRKMKEKKLPNKYEPLFIPKGL